MKLAFKEFHCDEERCGSIFLVRQKDLDRMKEEKRGIGVGCPSCFHLTPIKDGISVSLEYKGTFSYEGERDS